MQDWGQVMQFRSKRHIMDSKNSEQVLNSWLQSGRGQPIKLRLYEYGVASLHWLHVGDFKRVCIVPLSTDRAGATAEDSFQEILKRLQQQWEATFDGSSVVRQIWAKH
ncbi:hypothetical protein L917_11958 [Phytophthora nicotianae]|uniref:Uncharacterized protein n=2 Tax=Phytophthora nicotianae TaxID=4792 RepID=W2PXS2_PHYN3|nr:hypothetical protein PPTG_13145 [Phytophthora nicotianae INRA-310]ETL89035.1 hypothetical protein L917_11958 [Phytophthora nicotianae]ETM42281.1 hypothetical protein L914_12039 [Phytophthora nicotianae]ETN05748.1 hypothetical protein PPTG_13145 [Phytophthora nicotianae INRA-310]